MRYPDLNFFPDNLTLEMLATEAKMLGLFVFIPRLPFCQNLARIIGQHVDVSVMSQKRMLPVEQEPQKLYSLSLNAQTLNNFILLQVSTSLISRCTLKTFVCGAACQRAGLPDVIWPALHTWELLVGYTLVELGRKQAVSSLAKLPKQIGSSAQRWPSFPSGHFFSTPCSATWLYSQPDTESLWACFAAYLIICQTLQAHCWCQQFMKIGLIIPAGNCTWGQMSFLCLILKSFRQIRHLKDGLRFKCFWVPLLGMNCSKKG